MKPILLFFLMCCSVSVLLGQDADDRHLQSDELIQQLLEKFRELEPPKWSYQELATNSDLIVVAKVHSRVEVEWNDDIGGDFGKETTALLSNRLRVLSVLKGESAEEIDVMTLQWKPNVVVLIDSDFAAIRQKLLLPSLFRVVKEDGEVTGYGGSQPISVHEIEPEYLLYLRRFDGDRYVPVSGQRYSGMSVRMLNN